MKALAILAASAAVAMVPESAQAISLSFTLTGTDFHINPDGSVTPEDVNAQWLLDSNPTPSYYDSGAETFFYNVPGNFNYGTSIHADVDDLYFYATNQYSTTSQALFDSAGIIDIIGQAGKPFYTGSERSPVFQTGSFVVTDYFSNSPLMLTVAATPEPASWLLLISGFFIAGSVLRARRTSVSYTRAG